MDSPPRSAAHALGPLGEDAVGALSEKHGVPAVDLARVKFPLTNLDLVPHEVARRHVILPVIVREDTIVLAMGNPTDKRVIEELEFVSGRRVFPYAADLHQLAAAIEKAYDDQHRGKAEWVGSTDAGPNAPVQQSIPALPRKDSIELQFDEISEDIDLDAPAAEVPKPGRQTLDSAFGPAPVTKKSTVLVVDDEEDIRKLVRRVLEGKGFRVLEADRGSVALTMVKQFVPDAVVLDAMLPELHGFDICRRIKTSARYGHIPILMISAVYRGWRFAEDLKSSYGVSAYLEKPFRIADLVTAVESMLDGAPKPDERDPEQLTAEAEAALTQGMEAYRHGSLDEAIAHIERGIKLDPLAYRLHYHLGLLVGRKGDTFRAIQELETAAEIHPRCFSALKNLAVLYQNSGFKHKAIEMWERAVGQSPDEQTRGQIKEHLMSLL